MMPEVTRLKDQVGLYNTTKKNIKALPEYTSMLNSLSQYVNDLSPSTEITTNKIKPITSANNELKIATKGKYNTIQDALDNGFDLNTIPYFRQSFPELTNVYRQGLNELVNKNIDLSKYVSHFTISGDSKENKLLKSNIDGFFSKIIESPQQLEHLKPAFGDNWGNNPGFEDGKFIGTLPKGIKPHLATTENGVVIAIPILDQDKKQQTIYANFPNTNKRLEKAMLQSALSMSASSHDIDKADRQTMHNAYFNASFPANTLHADYADRIEVKKGESRDVFEFNYGNQPIKIVKEGLKTDKDPKSTTANTFYKIKVYDGKNWTDVQFPDKNGRMVTTGNDINSIRAGLGLMLVTGDQRNMELQKPTTNINDQYHF